MDLLRHILLFIHILGFAALLGGLLVQLSASEKSVNSLMRDGAGTAFVAGIGLVGVLEAGDGDVNHTKIGVKFVISLVILALVMVNLRKPSIPQGLYLGLLGLTVLNIGVAVFWSSAHV